MRPNIHPVYKEVKVTCSCGNSFVTRSTFDKDTLSLEVCAKCHPFYTGEQKIIDTAGHVERFNQKFGKFIKPAKEENNNKEDKK
jgi:large subunit ribosomal protein L31